ncbi:hypothetical protein GZL_00475 [Streptomyces sp. 769]|nr:hypothetical protein GZL_00475 [Streptomyces sp. 769]
MLGALVLRRCSRRSGGILRVERAEPGGVERPARLRRILARADGRAGRRRYVVRHGAGPGRGRGGGRRRGRGQCGRRHKAGDRRAGGQAADHTSGPGEAIAHPCSFVDRCASGNGEA